MADWARQWQGEVRLSARPNRFRVPPPPAVELGAVADDIGRGVDESARTAGTELRLTYRETKRVLCFWFAWYVETGRVVPNAEEFPGLLLEYGFGRVPVPPSTRFIDGADLFRNSIERAQGQAEAVANAATAAACSLSS